WRGHWFIVGPRGLWRSDRWRRRCSNRSTDVSTRYLSGHARLAALALLRPSERRRSLHTRRAKITPLTPASSWRLDKSETDERRFDLITKTGPRETGNFQL